MDLGGRILAMTVDQGELAFDLQHGQRGLYYPDQKMEK